MLEMRPATKDECVKDGKPFPKTTWSYAIADKDEVVAVTGYYFEEGKTILFSTIKPVARARCRWFARDVLKFARAVLDKAHRTGIPIAAKADPEIPGSDILLKHLGGTNIQKDIWTWPIHSLG